MSRRRRRSDEVSSITRDELIDTLSAGNDLTVVIRGHLILEVLMNRLLALSAPHQLTELERLDFSKKLDVVIAVGGLPLDARGAWRLVNDIRNRFGHQLHAELAKSDADDLLNAMPQDMRRSLRVIYRALDRDGTSQHRQPRAIVGNCIGWLATSASRAVVERGGEPMKRDWAFDDSSD